MIVREDVRVEVDQPEALTGGNVTSVVPVKVAPGRPVAVGVFAAVLAPVLVAVALLVFAQFGRGIEPDTGNAQNANLLFAAARLIVPGLAVAGGGWLLVAWWGRWSAARAVGAALLGLNLAGAVGFGLFTNLRTDIFDHGEHQACGMASAGGVVESVRCTLEVTNYETSTVTLEWQAVSEPPGAVFEPDSGVLAPGETTPTITIDAGNRCPVVFILRDVRQGKEIRSPLATSCPSPTG